MWYAVGAFLSPFVTMLPHGSGYELKTILRLLAVLTVLIVLSNATMDYRKIERGGEEGGRGERRIVDDKKKNSGFKEHGIPSGGWGIVLLYGP